MLHREGRIMRKGEIDMRNAAIFLAVLAGVVILNSRDSGQALAQNYNFRATKVSKDTPAVKVLFDFEEAADLKAWSNLALEGAKEKEPPAKIELSTDHATSGKRSLKITFAGGRWPTITTTQVLDDWLPYQTFHADVTVSRPCLVGFTALQEKSRRGDGYDLAVSRWTKTALLRPGMNHVSVAIHPPNQNAISAKWGKVVRFEIFMYNPHDGESIYVDNIQLRTEKQAAPSAKVHFPVAGTDWEPVGVSSATSNPSASAVIELGKKLKGRWTKPEAKTVAQIEKNFKDQYVAFKKKHPRAVLAILRDGEKGYDPAQPDRVYAGWKDAHINSHGPDGNHVGRARNRGKAATQEIFMRHRTALLRVDLSSIPHGAEILAARLIIVRSSSGKMNNPEQPNLWVVEPCNRPWDEYEVNAFQYAKDKFWTEIGGMHWGDHPDFLPVFLAYGPGQPKVNSWDFAEAVRFWTSGKHANNGFMLHGDSKDYMMAHTRKATAIKDRPAVLVIYEPK
jgi:hypothetical protein